MKKPNSNGSRRGTPPRPAGEPAIDFRRIYQVLREQAWFIVLCTVSFAALGLAYIIFARKIYASHTALVVEQQDRKVTNTLLNSQDVTQDDLHTLEVMKTIEQGLSAEALVLDIIRINGLADNPHFLPARPDEPYTDDELLLAFSKAVTVKLRRGTRLIDVTFENESPLLAKQVAQSLVDSYLRTSADQRANVSEAANAYLTREASRMKAKLEKSESELQAYTEQNNAISLEEKQNIVIETLRDLNLKLNAARTQRMQSEADFAQYKSLARGAPKALLALSAVAAAPSVLAAQKSVADQQAQLAMLVRRYRPEHPKYLQAQSRLTQMNDDLNRAILKSGETVPALYNAALDNEHKLEDALHDQEKISSTLNKIAIPYHALLRELEADRALYQSILNRIRGNDVARALENYPVRIAEPARETTEPVRPQKLLIMLATVSLGLGTGVGCCLLRDVADTSLKTIDEAEDALNLPVICAVPRLERSKKNGTNPDLVMLNEPASRTAEAFRALRTVLALPNVSGRQLVLFSGAAPGEGKTFCSLNCAIALAKQGYRTLLVDADLRRPSIGGMFGYDAKTPGLTNFLASEIGLSTAVRSTKVENLSLLTAGTTARNPAELLLKAKLAALFHDPAITAFDRVVVDTAPVNAVSDALSLVKHVDQVCLVVHAGRTPAKAVLRAHRVLAAAGAGEVGVVLNRLPRHCGAGSFYHDGSAYDNPGLHGAIPRITG